MNKVKIVTDSTCDLTLEELSVLDVHVIPLSIQVDGQSYIDGVDISPIQFIEKMRGVKELPKSSQPPVGEFVKLYDELGEDGSEILSIHMTGNMSGTMSAAHTASEMTQSKVTVVDSLFISRALGFQVKKAVELVNEGKSVNEIVMELEKSREGTRLYLMVDTLENLTKGGRIGKVSAMIGSLLKIKPIAMLQEGALQPVTKARNHTQAIKYLLEQLVTDTNGKKIKHIGIAHANALDLSLKLKGKIEELTAFNQTEIVVTTPIISTHTGEGAIGFMYQFEN